MNPRPRSDFEEAILYILLAAIGVIPVAVVLVRGGVFDSEATVGLIMLLIAIGGLFAMWRIARKHRLGR